MTKKCSKCHQWKPTISFGRLAKTKDGLDRTCKMCKSDRAKLYIKNPEVKKHRVALYLKKRYGLTITEYEELLHKQHDCCALCNRPASQFGKRLHVDHNHNTGKIRGLLCYHCNVVLGYVERGGFVESARQYLAQYESTT